MRRLKTSNGASTFTDSTSTMSEQQIDAELGTSVTKRTLRDFDKCLRQQLSYVLSASSSDHVVHPVYIFDRRLVP